MFSKRYKFSPQTCQFEVIRWTFPRILLTSFLVLVGGCIAGGGLLALVHSFWGNLEERIIEEKRDQYLSKLEKQNRQFSKLEHKLDRIHHKDNSFYRSILNVDRTGPGVWQGGIGGGENTLLAKRYQEVAQASNLVKQLNYKFKLQQKSLKKLNVLAKNKTNELKHIPAIRPVPGILVSDYGMRRNPFHGGREFHAGLDFRAPTGTPIKAVGDGIVTVSGSPQNGYGLQVVVNHGHGYVTKYAHCSKLMVHRGDSVNRGDVVALSGNTGYSTGPHLHYEVKKNGEKVNPRDYFYQN